MDRIYSPSPSLDKTTIDLIKQKVPPISVRIKKQLSQKTPDK